MEPWGTPDVTGILIRAIAPTQPLVVFVPQEVVANPSEQIAVSSQFI